MRISLVSRDLKSAVSWLFDVCKIKGMKPSIQRAGQVKIWHGDVVPMKTDRGDLCTEYRVTIPDSCQKHIQNFEAIPRLRENYQYIATRRREAAYCVC